MDTHAADKHGACVKHEEVQSAGFGLDLKQVAWIKVNPNMNLFKQKQTGCAGFAPSPPAAGSASGQQKLDDLKWS